MDTQTSARRPQRWVSLAAWLFATASIACTLAHAPPAGAWPITIPAGTNASGDLLLNFDTSTLIVPSQGMFTFYLATSGLNAGDSVVVDLFGGINGQNMIGVVYSGPLASLSGNCTIGDPLCALLLDGGFSIGLRATSGAVDLVAAFAYVAGLDRVPTSPVVATVGSALTQQSVAVPEPAPLTLMVVALLPLVALRRRAVAATRRQPGCRRSPAVTANGKRFSCGASGHDQRSS